MRIIAGEFRGRKLLGPESETTRPITDRVKQSLFDILQPLVQDARVYDCFAGTGSMGLECLSRGAARATFFELDRSAGQRLKQNIQTIAVADRATVISTDIFRWFEKTELPQDKIDLIFLDPPYRFLNERPDELRKLATRMRKHLSPEGQIIFRHDAEDSLEFPSLTVIDSRNYGSMTIQFLSGLA